MNEVERGFGNQREKLNLVNDENFMSVMARVKLFDLWEFSGNSKQVNWIIF